MITITINAESAAQAMQEVRELAGLTVAPAPAAAPATPTEDKPKRQRSASSTKQEEKKDEPAKESEADEDGGGEPTVTFEQLRAKLGKLSKAGKSEEIKKLLGGKLSDVKPEQYAAIMAAAEKLEEAEEGGDNEEPF